MEYTPFTAVWLNNQNNAEVTKCVFLTTEREIDTGDPKYDAVFGINSHFSVRPQVIQAALQQRSVFEF